MPLTTRKPAEAHDTELRRLEREQIALQRELDRLRVKTDDLRRENAHLHAALDAYVARSQTTRLFGPIEMTAGTNVGPRRRLPRRPAPSRRPE